MNDPEVTMLDALPNSNLIAYRKALEAAGIPVPGLKARDGLATINGSNLTNAIACLVVHDAEQQRGRHRLAHRAAVAGDSDPFDHGVDPVAVPFRIAAPLEHHHADAFSDSGPDEEVVRLADRHLQGSGDHGKALWALMVLSRWCESNGVS